MRARIPSLALAWIGVASLTAAAQPTAFTYQGQLKQQGVPLSGLVDLRFQLFDSDTAEIPVAGPVSFDGQSSNPSPVEVVNGLFTVAIDFGSDAFAQGGRWLQVEVRSPSDPTDAEAYVRLDPRQEITAVPFALSVPGLATTPGGGVEVAGDIHTAGEVVASAFSSNSPLIFKVNPANVECARFDDANCYFGLGVAAPQALLHLGGVPGVDGIMFPDGSLQTSAAGLGGGDGFWSAAGANIFNNNGGNVGIGSSAPNHRLRISGGPVWTSNGWTGALEFDNAAAIGWRSNAAGRRFGIGQSGGGLYFFHTTSDPGTSTSAATYDMVINDVGDVGIGTNTPLYKLNVETPAYGFLHTNGAVQFGTFATGDAGWFGTRSAHPLHFFTSDSLPRATLSTAGYFGVGSVTPQRRLHVAGNDLFVARFEGSHATAAVAEFRSGSSNNTWEFGVAGSAPPWALGPGDMYFYRQGNAAPGMVISRDNFVAELGCGDFKMGHTLRRGTPGRALVDSGDHLVINFARDWGRTAVHGLLQVNALQILGGADLSEQFDVAPVTERTLAGGAEARPDGLVDEQDLVQPGAVVCIDAENPGKLVVCSTAYDHTVAGVVSGAGGVNAGMIMGQEGSIADGRHPVALTGRVYTLCDATSGPIQPGDLLTTAGTTGHAMKAADRDRSHGALIGKAMSPLAAGERGLVLVLVNLQ